MKFLAMQRIVVTIDGPAGSGKTTCARELARRMGFAFLDTGAMYRAATLEALEKGLDLADEEAVASCAQKMRLELTADLAGGLKVILDGRDVTERIRGEDVTVNAKFVAANGEAREHMVRLQRRFAADRDIVTEGRDQGTVAFPRARMKFFLDASLKERVRRRSMELSARGEKVEPEELKKRMAARDRSDLERPVGALRRSADMVYLDTTDLSVDETVRLMEAFVSKAVHSPDPQGP